MTAPDAAAEFAARRDACAAEIEALLDRLLSPEPLAGEIARPERLLAAMRYAALGGGKRIRPVLVMETGALFGVQRGRSLMAGAALECIHCYSLAHDDLPAMDNDDLRRCRPTLHKAFDEATAILAGDALLTLAFDILVRPEVHPEPAVRGELVGAMARAAGLGGMAGGQMLDLDAEGRFTAARTPSMLSEGEVLRLQGMKTGALLRFACAAGAILAQAQPAERDALDRYGAALGQAFQISDDLLDAAGESAVMGKAARKDAAVGKGTLVGILGPEGARARCRALVNMAEEALAPFGERALVLRAAVRFVAERES